MRTLIVCLRVHAESNAKARPGWFSKAICVESLVDSVVQSRRAGAKVVTVAFVDPTGGPLAPDLLHQVNRFDHVFDNPGGSSRRSWVNHLRTLRGSVILKNCASHDLVYFVEDDHLHTIDAIHLLSTMPSEYGLLYSLSKNVRAHIAPALSDSGFEWVETMRGVSSFAVRVDALLRDFRLLILMSFAGPAFDLMTWQVIRGQTYFTWRQLFAPLKPEPPFERSAPHKQLYQIVWRLIANLLSGTRKRRRIVALNPSPATHSEVGWLAPEFDWESVARHVGENK